MICDVHPREHCRYLAFFVIHLFSRRRRDISPINIRYGHISKLILQVERFPEVRKPSASALYQSVNTFYRDLSKSYSLLKKKLFSVADFVEEVQTL